MTRLEQIKAMNKNAINIHQEGDVRFELADIVMELWTKEHVDWLIEQAEENARLREALQFYARKETYEYQHQYYGDGNVETLEEPIVDDKGEKARIALEETK